MNLRIIPIFEAKIGAQCFDFEIICPDIGVRTDLFYSSSCT